MIKIKGMMKKVDEKNVTVIEYRLFVSLIAVVIIVLGTIAGDQIISIYQRITDEVAAALT